MELVSRRIDHNWVEFPVYTIEEAGGLNLGAVPWRDAKAGQWGITDDGYVMECKLCRGYQSWNGWRDTFSRFTAGRVWHSRKKPFNFMEIHFNKGYGYTSGASVKDAALKRGVIKTLVHQAAIQRVTKGICDYKQLAKVLRHDDDPYYAILKVKRFLLGERGKKMVREEIERLLVDGGMTIADWVKLGERAFEKADAENDVTEMRRIWEKWGGFLAIKEAHRDISPVEGHKVLDAITDDLKQLPAAKGSANEQ